MAKTKGSSKAESDGDVLVLPKATLRGLEPERIESEGRTVLLVVEDGQNEQVDTRPVKTTYRDPETKALIPVISRGEYNDYQQGLKERDSRITAAQTLTDRGETVYLTGSADGVNFIITQDGDDEFSQKAYEVDANGVLSETDVERFLPEPEEDEEEQS